MAISSDGDMVGSVSGGCIEGEVREQALTVLAGESARIVEYGIADESAWSVGLSCGGAVRVLIQRFPSVGPKWLDAIAAGERNVLASTLQNDEAFNLLIGPNGETSGVWPGDTADLIATGSDSDLTSERDIGGIRSFVHVVSEPEQVIIIGASDIAVSLVGMAHSLGIDTIVIDPRAVFTDPGRFPVTPTRLETEWPQKVLQHMGKHRNTYAVLLTHDPKIDDPALHILLKSDAAYIGALGSRRTQEKRKERLRKEGFSDAACGRIHGPVGLDIGASNPAEIALSIMAEIVSIRNSTR